MANKIVGRRSVGILSRIIFSAVMLDMLCVDRVRNYEIVLTIRMFVPTSDNVKWIIESCRKWK